MENDVPLFLFASPWLSTTFCRLLKFDFDVNKPGRWENVLTGNKKGDWKEFHPACVDDGAGGYVPVPALAVSRVGHEQPGVMALLGDDVRDGGVVAAVAEALERGPQERDLLLEHSLELALGHAVAVEDDALGPRVGIAGAPVGVEVLDHDLAGHGLEVVDHLLAVRLCAEPRDVLRAAAVDVANQRGDGGSLRPGRSVGDVAAEDDGRLGEELRGAARGRVGAGDGGDEHVDAAQLGVDLLHDVREGLVVEAAAAAPAAAPAAAAAAATAAAQTVR